LVEAQLSAGIVRRKGPDLNIPEADYCGEAVDTPSNPWRTEENQFNSKKRNLISYVMFCTVGSGTGLAENSPIDITRVLDGVKPESARPEPGVEHTA
jgi:hypothetical protein